MRKVHALAITAALVATLGTTRGDEVKTLPPAPKVAHSGPAENAPPLAEGASGAGAANGCAGHAGCGRARCGAPVLQRVRDWLTYRAAPAPRECKCQRKCAACT